jgi:hypothetical protein
MKTAVLITPGPSVSVSLIVLSGFQISFGYSIGTSKSMNIRLAKGAVQALMQTGYSPLNAHPINV